MPLDVNIVASDRVLWTGEATRVIAPTVEGEIGLLPGHEPVLSVLRAGEIRVLEMDGSTKSRARCRRVHLARPRRCDDRRGPGSRAGRVARERL